MDTEPHLEALTQHVAGRLTVPGASAAAEIKVLMDSGSGITAMSEELVEALRRPPGMVQIALTQAFVGHARVITSLGHERDIVTQSYPLHLTIETPWGPVRFTMLFIVLPVGGDVVTFPSISQRSRVGTSDTFTTRKVNVFGATLLLVAKEKPLEGLVSMSRTDFSSING